MIVDLHTHIWDSPDQLGRGAAQRVLRNVAQPWDRPDASTSAHDAAMEPVQHAVILGFESRYLGASIPVDQVARYVARRPGKFLGFAGIDPLGADFLRKVEHAKALGLVGVTISPAAQGFHPSHSRAMALYEKCADLGFPILVHGVTHLSAEAKLEFSQPYLLDEVAREFPRLRLIIAQVGHPWIEQTLVLVGKHRNVFADLSNVVTRPWQLYNLLLSAHQQNVSDRLLFGSDFPFCTPQKAITTIYSVNTLTQGTMLPSVPREQLRQIVERDVLELLGLKKTSAAEKSPAAPAKPVSNPIAIAPAVATAVPQTMVTSAMPPPATAAPMTPPASALGSNGSHERGEPAAAPPQAIAPAAAENDAEPADDAATPGSLDSAAPPQPMVRASTDDQSTVIDPYEIDDESKSSAAASKPSTASSDDAIEAESPQTLGNRPQGTDA